MRVFKHLGDVAKGLGVKDWEVEKAYNSTFHRGSFFIGETNIIIQSGGERLLFVEIDRKSNEDCKKYFMEYEKDLYDFKVYVDSIEGWQSCKVINIKNTRMGIDRATVVTKSGTQLNRICKFLLDGEYEEIKKDGCIYFWEK